MRARGLLALGVALLSACGPQEAPAARESLKTVAHAAPGTSPDLVVRLLDVPASAWPEDRVRLSFEVCNRMPYPAGAFQVEVRLSTDTDFTPGDPKLVRREVAGLGASLCARIDADVAPPNIPEGLYHVAAVADADGQVAEDDEVNNLVRGRTFAVGSLPDFIVSDVRAPLIVDSGQPFIATATVCNQGAVSGGSEVHFNLSDVPDLDRHPWEMEGASTQVLDLAPGHCQDVEWEMSQVWGGWHFYVGARVDPWGHVPELVETNNLVAAGELELGPAHELAITEVSGPAHLSPDTAFSAWVTVCNQGTRPTNTYAFVDLFASADEAQFPGLGRFLGHTWVDPLAAGQCARRRVEVSLPGLPAGSWYLGAVLDVYDVFEHNDVRVGSRVQVGQAPDFTVTALQLLSTLRPDETSLARVTVCNQGTTGGPVDVGLYLSSDEELFLPEPSAGSLGLGLLEPGQCVTQDVPVTLPDGVFDTRYLLARVDAGNVWAELDESNNLRTGGRMFLGWGFDLAVTALEAPASVREDTQFLARATVCNRGSTAAPPSYLDVDWRLASQVSGYFQPAGDVMLPGLEPGACTTREVPSSLYFAPYREPVLLRARVYAVSGEEDPFRDNDTSAPLLPIGVGDWPDFAITSVVGPPGVSPGQGFSTQVTVCNQGTEPGSSDVTVVLSQDASISVQDLFAGWAETGLLQPGQCARLEVPSHAGSLWPGTFTVGAVVDPYGDPFFINELREDNNVGVGAPLGLGTGADFAVTAMETLSSMAPGGAYSLEVTVCNQGLQRAATDVAFVLSRDAIITRADPVLGSAAVDALDPGGCATREVMVLGPASEQVGFLGALVDTPDLHLEPREDDNARAGGILAVGFRPDLTVSILEAPSSVAPTASFPTKLRVCNEGREASAANGVELLLSTDARPGNGDWQRGGGPVEPLEPGQCVVLEVQSFDSTWSQLPVGRWYWIAHVNGFGGGEPELRLDNNADARPLEVGLKPDFAVTALALPPSVLAGAPFTARATVCNRGTASGSTQVRLIRSWVPEHAGPADTLGQAATGSLSPGQCAAVGIAAQAGLAPEGVYSLAAMADPGRTSEEPREDDNVSSALLGVGELPDFTVRAVKVPVASAAPAAQTPVSVRVCNEGTAAGGLDVELYLSRDAAISTGDMPLGSVPVDPLAPGLCALVDVPVSLWVPEPGTWFVGAVADAYGSWPELREDNNASTGTSVGVGLLPDFTVTQVRAPAGARQGEPFPLTVEVCNTGVEAGSVDVSIYASLDTELTPADLVFAAHDFGLLGAGRCSMVELPLTFWQAPREVGPWYVGVVADVGQTRPELSETNNTGPVVPLGIGELPDAVVTRVVAPPSVRPGEEFSVQMTACNQGTAWATSVAIQARLSRDPEGNHLGAQRFITGVGPLAPDDCTTNELRVTASDDPGTWYLFPEVFLGQGLELSTGNNRGRGVPVRVGLLPDFTVSTVALPSGVRPGQGFEAQVTVCNQGTEPGGTDVALFVSRDAELSVEDPVTEPRPAGLLQAGQCAVYPLPVGPLSEESGTWYVGAVVDGTSQGAELSEENNTLAGVPVGVGNLPDFTITSVQAPPSVLPDVPFTTRVTVCNQGTQPGNPELSLHLSLDTVITRDDLALSPALLLGPLGAGACTGYELFTRAPVTREGTWYLGAVVDPARQVAELVESNNASEARPLGVGQRPDLVVAEILAEPLVRPGTPTPVNVRVCNQGTASASTSELMVALARLPEVPLPYDGNSTLPVGTLAAGACRWLTTEYYLHAGQEPHYVTAWVDAYRMVPELIETNNQRIGPQLIAEERADLVMGAVQAPASVDPGKPFTASAQVCNQGLAPAAAQVAFHLSPDAQVTVQDPVIGTAPPVTLSPGQCATATAQAESLQAGSFHLAAIADGADTVPEYSDADNVGPASALRVVSAGMDFAVTSLEVTRIVRQVEERIASMRVCNLGLTAGDTRVRFYGSPDPQVDTADTRLADLGLYFLQPGECTALFLRMLPPGAGYMAAIADPLNERPEADELNNTSPIVRVAAGDLRDLTIASLKAPAFERQDGPLPVEVTVCNQGTVSTAPTEVRFQLLEGSSAIEGQLGAPSLPVPALDRNQCVRLEQSLGSQSNAARDWTLVATVDGAAQQAEVFEDNNTAQAAVRLGDFVELAVTRVTAPSTVAPGAPFTGEVTVCNSGSISATQVRLALLLSADGTPAAGVQVGVGTLSGLGKECAVFPVEGTVPTQGLTGEVHLLARAELVSPSGRESFPGDNVLAGPRLGIGSGPDLVVSSVKAPLALLAPERAVEVSVQLCNQGTTGAASSRVEVSFVPGDAGARQPVSGGTVSVGAVPAGACVPVTVAAMAPQVRGTWRLEAAVDPDNTVHESVEGNNETRGELLSVLGYPRLVVTELLAPSGVRLGQSLSATATVCNREEGPVSSFPVRFSFQTEDGFPARELFEARTPDGLMPGACAQVVMSSIPAALPRQGAWRLVARLGTPGVFPRELDPVYTRGVTLGVGSGPDFVVTSVSGPTSVRAGASYSTAVTVCNRGTVSGSATVTAYLSRDEVVTLSSLQGLADVPAGQTSSVSLSVGQCRTLPVPSQARVGAGGTWYMGALLTPSDLVPGNNGLAGARIAVTP